MAKSPSRRARPLLLALLALVLAYAAFANRSAAEAGDESSSRPAGPARQARIDDEAQVLAPADVPRFEQYLAQIFAENGADIRMTFVREVPNGDLESFSLGRARAIGIGRESDRRGMLFVYDVSGKHLRIEVGPQLEGVFPDGFVGYLMREHARAFFSASDPGLGLRTTLFMIQRRMREASLGMAYDPAAYSFITDSVRLAAGAGATARVALGNDSSGFLRGSASDAERRYFAPQPTVEAAYQRYLEWMRSGGFRSDVTLFTSASQAFLGSMPITPAFNDYILFAEYGHKYTVDEREDLALLIFTDTPLVCPHFFRRSADGWQMDVLAEVQNTREYAGGPFTWGMTHKGTDFADRFADRHVRVSGLTRISGGDNRPMPVRGNGAEGAGQ